MTPRTRRFAALLCALAGLAACDHDPAPSTAPPIDTAERALHGGAALRQCDFPQRAALLDALDYARDRAASADYHQCLLDAYGVEADGRMVEALVDATNSDAAVDITCVYGGYAFEAEPGAGTMRISSNIIAAESAAELAGRIVGGIARMHGWTSWSGVPSHWPTQVASCLEAGVPYGASRAQVAGARLLAPVGGAGGAYHRLRCGEDEAAVGVEVALSGDLRFVGLVPICRAIVGDDPVGPEWRPDMPAHNPRFSYDLRCGAGEAVVGLKGQAAQFVGSVDVLCADIADLRAYAGAVPAVDTGVSSQPGSHGFVRRCPGRGVATGMRVRTSDRLDGFQLECDDFPLQGRSLGIALRGHGGDGGRYGQLECPDGFGLFGIFGQTSSVGIDTRTIGGRCRPLNDHGVSQAAGWGAMVAHTEIAGGVRATADPAFRYADDCALDEVLVGLHIAADDHVTDVVPLCAPHADWMAGDRGFAPAAPLNVVPPSVGRQVVCPARQVAIALEVYSDARIDRIDLRCKAPELAGALRTLAPMGDASYADFEQVCPDGRPLVGLRTEVGQSHLAGVSSVCGRHTDWGTSTRDPLTLANHQGEAFPSHSDTCPLGAVLVGVETAHDAQHVAWLRGLCADEGFVRAGTASGLSSTPWRGVGGQWNRIERRVCAPGEVVRGLHGDEGGGVAGLGVLCGAVPLVPGSLARGEAAQGRGTTHLLTLPAGFDGDLRLILTGPADLQPTVRIRRGARPTAQANDGEVQGVDGVAWLDVAGLEPGRYVVEIIARTAAVGAYSLAIDET